MNWKMAGRVPVCAATLVLAACAATSPAQPTAAAPTAAATQPAVPGSAPASNYKRVVRSGQTLYCKKETPTGTRFVEETCLTQAQMDAREKNAQNFTDDVHGMAVLPPTSPNVR
jgi:cytochrome c